MQISIRIYLSAQFQCLISLPRTGQTFCLQFDLHFFSFNSNLICDMTTFRLLFFFLGGGGGGGGQGCVKEQHIYLHGVLCYIPVNLICNMIILSEKKKYTVPDTIFFMFSLYKPLSYM